MNELATREGWMEINAIKENMIQPHGSGTIKEDYLLYQELVAHENGFLMSENHKKLKILKI